jgi:hypothetical protein
MKGVLCYIDCLFGFKSSAVVGEAIGQILFASLNH